MVGKVLAVLDIEEVSWTLKKYRSMKAPRVMQREHGRVSQSPKGYGQAGNNKDIGTRRARNKRAIKKAVASMNRTGCCYDNAPMESFFHTLKVELVHQHRWTTREEAKRNLFAYIEGYYSRARIHSALGYLTPEQAETKAS